MFLLHDNIEDNTVVSGFSQVLSVTELPVFIEHANYWRKKTWKYFRGENASENRLRDLLRIQTVGWKKGKKQLSPIKV